MIDFALKWGSNEPKSLERIVTQFQKGKTTAENADFLRREFGINGRGYRYCSEAHDHSALVAGWFDKDGMTLGAGNFAHNPNFNMHLSWEQVAERIGTLLQNGAFTSQDVIDRAADHELGDMAERLLFLERDVTIDFFLTEEMTRGGFPECKEKVKAALTDPETVQEYINGMKAFLREYEQDPDALRMHYHKPKELLQRLQDLQLERTEFPAKPDFSFKLQFSITEDEKDQLLYTRGSGIESGKFRITEFLAEEHTLPEKIKFLKNEYGIGGIGSTGYNESHDGKGILLEKDAFSRESKCSALMKWNEVAERVERLIAEGKYITQQDIDERIRCAKSDLQSSTEGTFNQYVIDRAKKVLEQYSVPLDETPKKEPENIDQGDAAFMNLKNDEIVELQQVDEGLAYTIFATDLTIIDGGIWELEEAIDLRFAAAQVLSVSEQDLVEIQDYEKSHELLEEDTDLNVPEKLAKLKADAINHALDISHELEIAEKAETEITEIEAKQAEPKSAVNVPERVAAEKQAPKTGIPITYHFHPDDVVHGGAKSRFKSNIEAIRVLQKIEAENRYATPEEQSIMAKYVGWGGIPQAFTTDRATDSIGNLGEAAPTGWEDEQRQLRNLLTPEEYRAARASTQTSFYTPSDITDGIYLALQQFGFSGGDVLEPSMGVGSFFSKMPEDMRQGSRLYGVELDSISGRIAQQLYSQDRIQVKGFEQTHFNNNSFDVVIGNVPFGDYRVSDKAYDKYKFKIHDDFVAKSVDKVKPGCVVAIMRCSVQAA